MILNKGNYRKHAAIPGRCPVCGGEIEYRSAVGVYKHETRAKETMLYICRNYPKCDMYVRTLPGTDIPAGTLANRRLRQLRREAHALINQLHTSGVMGKDDVYCMLGTLIQAPRSECHIGYLGEYYCSLFIRKCKEVLMNYGKTPRVPHYGLAERKTAL